MADDAATTTTTTTAAAPAAAATAATAAAATAAAAAAAAPAAAAAAAPAAAAPAAIPSLLTDGTGNTNTGGDGKGGAGDAAAAGDKPAGDKPPKTAAGAPEAYDLKLPEGTTLDAARMEKFTALAKELNVSNEKAQALLDLGTEMVADAKAQAVTQWHDTQRGWIENLPKDKELGGPDSKEKIALAAGALQKFGSPELVNSLKESGWSNYPELIRVFYRIGKAMSDDTFVQGGASAAEGRMEDRMFPSMTKKN